MLEPMQNFQYQTDDVAGARYARQANPTPFDRHTTDMNQAPRACQASTQPQRPAGIAFDPAPASLPLGAVGTTFECCGRIWAVRRAPSFAAHGPARYTVIDLETGHGIWHVQATNVAAARVLAVSAITMMPLPVPSPMLCQHLAASAALRAPAC